MSKSNIKQHIVPKRYLDRFASLNNDKKVIGTMYRDGEEVSFFIEGTSDVGYIKNYYDVSDEDDSKRWEHFFAKEIDSLCGKEMNAIISRVLLTEVGKCVLSDHSIEILARIIVAQMLRVPSAINFIDGFFPELEEKVKKDVIAKSHRQLSEEMKRKVHEFHFNKQQRKELYLNISFEPHRFEALCKMMHSRIWVIYVNEAYKVFPFVTSDNPVLVEGMTHTNLGVFHNGINNPGTCIFFPLTPAIAVASYSKEGVVGLAEEQIDRKKVVIDDMNYILERNCRIVEQAYKHSFFPQPLFDAINS